jgi:hypothetical protein
LYLAEGLTPRLTGAGGPIGPQGTNSGQDNAEGMPAVCVRVEPLVSQHSHAGQPFTGPCPEHQAREIRGKDSGLRIDSTDRSTSRLGQYRCSGLGRSTSVICSTVADLNQGNWANGSSNSSSPRSSQKPCLEMLVTSAPEVVVPSIFNFLQMSLDDDLRIRELPRRQAGRRGDMNGWGQPELGLAIRMSHMYVDARLFTREEEQTERTVPHYSWCHAATVTDPPRQGHPASSGHQLGCLFVLANARVNRRRSAKRAGHQHWPSKSRSDGQCWRPR